ncbi:4509_t:CDS:10 [Paraglomus brasilianum]|uniref:4509_t:CDS:1 n=1 Tax=Paraglomus brasilianum TaxID=144538 RepID=A0A9N8ZWD7_9GLOM|nr:4509_t:CDS:10 [Paraglomus brasilianum]
MSSSSLAVPIARWDHPPYSPVTCIAYKEAHIVTGLKNGCLWIYTWRIGERGNIELRHKIFCIGHSSPVTTLAIIENQTDGNAGNKYVVISASEDGEIMKWSLIDGRCLASISCVLDGIPMALNCLADYTQPAKYILCSGFSNEIAILNVSNLEVVRVWGGHNDWAACTPFYDSDARQIRLLTCTFNGKLRIWSFDETKQTITKEYDVINVLSANGEKIFKLVNNPYDIGVILAISRNSVSTFTVRRNKALNVQRIDVPNSGEIWQSGAFAPKSKLILWTERGNAYVYMLPPMDRAYSVDNGSTSHRRSVSRRSSIPLTANENANTERTTHAGRSRNYSDSTRFSWKSLSANTPKMRIIESESDEIPMNRWNVESDLASLWPLKKEDNMAEATVSAMIYEEHMAFGYDNGEIHIYPLSKVLSEDFSTADKLSDIRILRGHYGRITCIYTPSSSNFGKKYILTGGEDFSVRIWSFENGKRLAKFATHSQPVTTFIDVPCDVGTRLRGCVVSIARDNSLSIISLEEMSCLYAFEGHTHGIAGLQWRPSRDLLVIFYQDESAHCWQIHSGTLDKIVCGKAARDMMNERQWKMSVIPSNEISKRTGSKSTSITSQPIHFQETDTTPLHILTINIKQLINDIYHYHVSSFGSFALFKSSSTEELNEKSPMLQSKIVSWATPIHSNQLTGGASSASASPLSSETESRALGPKLVDSLISCLISWGVDDEMDKICVEKLGLKRSCNGISLGLKGANGCLSVAAPSPGDGRAQWKISPIITATRLEKYSNDLITHYGTRLPHRIDGFCYPSLSFLAKYFQDSVPDVQSAARTLFTSSLNSMPREQQQAVIDYWKQFLPAVASGPDFSNNQYMARSTILLAMIGVDNPKALPENVAESISLSLTILLNDEAKPSNRLAALDLSIDSDTNVAPVKAMARQAIFHVASINTPLFISTLICDTMNTKKPAEKKGYLRLVSLFIKKMPHVLYSSLPKVVAAVVKSLDPNIPNMRETVLQTSTGILHDLVKTFPSISFHGPSQKLAVGTLEGATVVYDLRTATQCQVLEGHTRAVTALSFSEDGKRIVSCSLDEKTVRVWNPSPSLLGVFGGASRDRKAFGFNLGDDVHLSVPASNNVIHFEWPSENTVKLYVHENIMSFNV